MQLRDYNIKQVQLTYLLSILTKFQADILDLAAGFRLAGQCQKVRELLIVVD